MSRLVLVGCVQRKLNVPAPARDLYVSPLFRKRRAYAEASGEAWAILSAYRGLLLPHELVFPYNVVLTPPRIAAWAGQVRQQLRHTVGDSLDGLVLEVHAGRHYVDGVERCARYLARFEDTHVTVEAPLAGLAIGKQLAWYVEHKVGVTA